MANKRAEWSFRLIQEQQSAQNAWFVTLTYSDENICYSNSEYPSLNKLDLQLWMKKLRRRIDRMSTHLYNFQMATNEKKQIRYYTVGEYGTQTQRPHYHSILFNVPKMELKQAHLTWKHGSVHIGAVTPASIHYVTGYIMGQNKKLSLELGRQPEFALMSRNPGIGISYIERKSDWNKKNQYNYVISNGFKQSIPRYYKDKIFNKSELSIFSAAAQEKSLEQYHKNIATMEQLGIKDPDNHLDRNRYKESLNFEKKFNKNQIF